MNAKIVLAALIGVDLILAGILAGVLISKSMKLDNALGARARQDISNSVASVSASQNRMDPSATGKACAPFTTNDFDRQWVRLEGSGP